MASTTDDAVRECLRDEHRVQLLNVLHDDRISVKRRAGFDTVFAATPDPKTVRPSEPKRAARIQQAVSSYYTQRVAVADSPDYISIPLNGDNIVPFAAPGGKPGIHPDTWLAHVIELTRYFPALQAAKYLVTPAGAGAKADVIIPWLSEHLPFFPASHVPGKPDSEVDVFVDKVLTAIHDYCGAMRPAPVWAAYWREFEGYVEYGPSTWMQALGMRDEYDGRPLFPLVVVYETHRVNSLLRPTVLDAGGSPFHFPSPAVIPVEQGGFVMDRSPINGLAKPLSEFVHQAGSKPFTAQDWRRGKGLSGPTTPTASPAPLPLPASRRRHYERLKARLNPLPAGWLKDETCLR